LLAPYIRNIVGPVDKDGNMIVKCVYNVKLTMSWK
jgi:hypothetical protein